jgi:hypothetical protein
VISDDTARCVGAPIGNAWKCAHRTLCERYIVFKKFCDEQSEKSPDERDSHIWPLQSVLIDKPDSICGFIIPVAENQPAND